MGHPLRGLAILMALLCLLGMGCSTVNQQALKNGNERHTATNEPCISLDLHVPQTNAEIRLWYNYQVVAISEINKRWMTEGLSPQARAQRAFTLRHNARINARFMMPNQAEVKALQQRDVEKYGNPNGPTFEYLVEKNRQKGLQGDQVYEAIVASSSRTSPVFNKTFGVKRN